jgi:predicted transcriptional regulator
MSMSTKQAVLDLLERLPEDCTLDDVQYHLYVLQTIERGRREITEGKELTHEDVKRELRAKWRSSAK